MNGTGHGTHDLHPNEKLVFGHDAKRHPITGLVLEQGSGALSPDLQARRVHLPEIARTQGPDAAAEVRKRLDEADAAPKAAAAAAARGAMVADTHAGRGVADALNLVDLKPDAAVRPT
jgi:hypothetical protein